MEKPDGDDEQNDLKGFVGGAIKNQISGIVSATGMIKKIVFGSAIRIMTFIAWLATLVLTVIVHVNYEVHSSIETSPTRASQNPCSADCQRAKKLDKKQVLQSMWKANPCGRLTFLQVLW